MIIMREAREEDCKAVFELSNDPLIRSVSFSTAPIPFETHARWFASRLTDPACHFLLFLNEGELAAQIRFAKDGEDVAEVSISLSPAYRGKGIAVSLMKEALESARMRWGISRVRALVKCDNGASNHYFLKAGYELHDRTNYKGSDCNVYYYRWK